MQNESSQTNLMSQDISVAEICAVMAKRKKLIGAFFVASLALAVIFIAVKQPVFETRVKIRIGQVAAAGSFESPEVLASRLMAMYGEDLADGVKRERPFLRQVSVPRNIPAAVEVVAEADSPEEAAEFLRHVFAQVKTTHEAIYSQNLAVISERVRNLDAQRAALAEQFAESTDLIDRLKPDDAVQASLIMLERGRISALITGLEAEKPALAQRMTPPQTQPTELLGEITAPRKPAAPKRTMVVALALFAGLVGGVLLALVLEMTKRSAVRRRTMPSP